MEKEKEKENLNEKKKSQIAHLEASEEGLGDVDAEVGPGLDAVPRVGDVAAVHDLAEDVPEVLSRHRRVVVEVEEEHEGADGVDQGEVAVVEAVGARPALGPDE